MLVPQRYRHGIGIAMEKITSPQGNVYTQFMTYRSSSWQNAELSIVCRHVEGTCARRRDISFQHDIDTEESKSL